MPAPATPVIQPAGHGAAIEMLAITDDGRAAVTQDAIGGTRLWPALDGTREPIVVALAPARQLAIGRAGGGFVIAALDEGGGAEVLRVAAAGNVLSRASIAPEPEIESLAIAPQGVLARRADQTLAIVSATGEQLARLAAPARSRIEHVLARNGHTLVVLRRDDSMYGRWLAGTSWGETTPDFMIDPHSRALLSPSGKRLLIDFGNATYLLDAHTGSIVTSYSGSTPVGFVDDATVMVLEGSRLVWQTIGGAYGSELVESVDSMEPMAAATGVVVGVNQASLVLHSRERVEQLGYAIGDVPSMHALGNQLLVFDGRRTALVLDDSLEQRATLTLPRDDRTLNDIVPIDDRFVLATHTFASAGWGALSVIDLEASRTHQTTMHALIGTQLRYEPATQLLEVTDHSASYLTKWDSGEHKLTTWYVLAGGMADVHLLDPRSNDGVVAIALRIKDGKLVIGEIDGADLEIGAPIEPRHHYFVEGVPTAVDKLGTVYVNEKGHAVVGYKHGVEVVRIANSRDLEVAVHPGGAYIALYGDQRIELYAATGALRWQVAAPLAQQIAWLGNDLVVDYAGGVGKIDAATGALIKRTCGWSFGLRALSTNDLLAGDSICDAQ